MADRHHLISSSHELILRWAVAFVWLATGLLVFHPMYRAVGVAELARLGLPGWLMYATCGAEVVLGMAIVTRPPTLHMTAIQVAVVCVFSLILAVTQPMLLVNPFGMLTKNIPFCAVVVATLLVHREGWTVRARGVLRGGVAAIWITEGLLPKILFQQEVELEVVAASGLVPIDPGVFLAALGVVQVASGIAVLVLRGGALRFVLQAQLAALVLLPALVSYQMPSLLVHPFGPMTKNVPIAAGTWVLIWFTRAPGGGAR